MSENRLEPDIPMKVSGIGRLMPGNYVTVAYTSPRIKHGFERSRDGEIESIETLSDGRPRFVFIDDHEARTIEVTIGNTTGESKIRSLGERNTTFGTPIRVRIFEDAEDRSQSMNEGIREHYDGEFPSFVAAAYIKWNESILDWLEWTEENA